MRRKDYNKEFDEAYEKYCDELERLSGGLVETNKAEFMKQYVFYLTTINPSLEDYFKALVKLVK